MKSPEELRVRLRRQWESGAKREDRLLGGESHWPVVISIGRPSPKTLVSELDAVRSHIEQWRNVTVGEVAWNTLRYRAASGPVDVPATWKLRQPSEWIDACADRTIRAEFESLAHLVELTDP